MSWLYRFESKGIQAWILESDQLRDLAGGSALIESLTQEASDRARAANATRILQATSGAMTAAFPDRESLAAFAETWPMALDQLAPGLTVVQAWCPEAEGLAGLHARLAARRNLPGVSAPACGPWVLRTGRSGQPAVVPPQLAQRRPGGTTLDMAAIAKELAYQAYRESPGTVTGGLKWSEFETEVDRWGEAPIAVLHADGSGIGQRLMQLGGDPARLAAFSEALQEATVAAVKQAVETLERDHRSGRLLARPVVSAGDDLTYIVPAARARRFCLAWQQAFTAETSARADVLGGAMASGAGAVFVHRHYPFAQAYELAEALCGAAKQVARADGGEPASVFACQRITTSLEADVRAHGTAWRIVPGRGLAEFEALMAEVSGLPRGMLRTWLTAFEAGDDVEAHQRWQRGREVAGERKWQPFAKALVAVGADPETGAWPAGATNAWPLTPGGRATPVRDALALGHVEGKDQ